MTRRIMAVDRIALAVAALMVALAVVGPLLAPHDPYAVDLADALQGPSAAHWFGTDVNGRDVLSRILYGAQVTLPATVIVIAAATLIGTLVGTVAALGGKALDEVLMRITDIGLSLPSIILALGLAAALGSGLRSAVVALALTWWPGYARLVRTLVREVKDAEYVDAARTLGVSRARLVFRHILPNALNSLYVQTTLDVSAVMLVISGLSFVGVGAQVPSAEWGAMIAAAANNLTNGWWAVAFPGLAIMLTAVAFNLVGDWLRVRNDPTIREGVR
ncbi:peptide ABC transporter permease [Acrocarpospora corrugata]|uniref:Peptide ABC transporter permease n=1 Tax=Acrocarpospora corrugata TaxID=35763 RepID=A0A5M3VXY4_9ACTN|nr:ABC transporter permease [Acrocarpospora corrugata]GES00949.1 peptide ABC transporter permease [Acrocarpospora corrugata]